MMDTSTSKRFAVNPIRLLKLFGIVIGSFILLGIMAVVSVAEWPLLTSTLWHMRHGSTVELEGHSFPVPLFYEPEVSEGGKQIDIIESRRLFTAGSSVTVSIMPRVLDLASINRWQGGLIAAGNNNRNDAVRSVPLTLHGKKLTFVCIDLTLGGESLVCHAVGTDMTVSTWASPAHIKEIRSMLETSE